MHVQAYETARVSGPYDHRPGGIRLTEMLCGEEFALDNFALWVVDTADQYFTPRHRHNFDQVRVMLEGEYGWSPNDVHKPGTIGYFTEGTYYAQRGIGESRMLLLQVAGASGQGYMSLAQLDRGIKELKERGAFKDGVYTEVDANGQKHNKDGHEAVWEHTFGKPVSYQAPRFQMPVFIEPEGFGWLPASSDGLVHRRRFGVLNERGLEVGEAKLAPGGKFVLDSPERPLLVFVMEGEGTAADVPFGRYAAAHIKRGERATILAATEMRLVLFGLPTFESNSMALAAA